MKKFKKLLFLVPILALMVFSLALSGCYKGQLSADGRMFLGYSKSDKKAFVGMLGGDLENTEFVLPDEYMGYPVTTLGGFIGRGFPCPFSFDIELPEQYAEYVEQQKVFSANTSYSDETEDGWETVVFRITLGRNVKEIFRATPCIYLGIISGYDEEGAPISDLIYKIVPYFIVPELNQTFYAVDGRLFYRSSGEPAGNFEYE